jgi:hypothetical protein
MGGGGESFPGRHRSKGRVKGVAEIAAIQKHYFERIAEILDGAMMAVRKMQKEDIPPFQPLQPKSL